MFSITVRKVPILEKPPQDVRGKISQQINEVISVSIKEFSQILVPPCAWAWTMATFSPNKINNDNWQQQQVFALDFDNDAKRETISPEEVKSRLSNYGIDLNLLYTTLSDSPEKRKFRVIIILEEPILDRVYAVYVWNALKYLFPEADPQPTALASYLFPGKEVEIFSEKPTPNDQFRRFIDLLTELSDKGNSREVKKERARGLNNPERGIGISPPHWQQGIH